MRNQIPWVALPAAAAAKIREAVSSSGGIRLRDGSRNLMYVPDQIEVTKDVWLPAAPASEFKALLYGDGRVSGQWKRLPGSKINLIHLDTLQRGSDLVLTYAAFKELVPDLRDPGAKVGLLITYDPEITEEWRSVGASELAAWLVTRGGVQPIPLAIEPEWGLSQIADKWPLAAMQRATVGIVGLGSIGGAAAEALAGYGVGTLHFMDPDRFLWHNMVRHVLAHDSVGLFKVDAMKHHLRTKWPDAAVEAHVLDVVADAHLARPLFRDLDLILCAADGIAPRRVVSHLARRAKRPAVLACVLDDGAVGEVVRLRPAPRYGCLLCLRAHLRQQGSIDVEAAQELEYGTGHIHRPMTAVGPDLQLMGQLAAKAVVATLLESQHGDHTQRLPGDLATIGLRPPGDMASPFDLAHPLEINWYELPSPRPDCPTCNP